MLQILVVAVDLKGQVKDSFSISIVSFGLTAEYIAFVSS